MEKSKFAALSYESRMNYYEETLSKHPEVGTIKELVSVIQKEYCQDDPVDYTINYNRVQRDIKRFFKENGVKSTNPIEGLRKWIKAHYLPEDDQNYIVANAMDFVFAENNGNSDKMVFVRTLPFGAEQMAYRLRKIYADMKPFIIADYDSIMMYFEKEEQYRAFRDKFDPYLESGPDDEDTEKENG